MTNHTDCIKVTFTNITQHCLTLNFVQLHSSYCYSVADDDTPQTEQIQAWNNTLNSFKNGHVQQDGFLQGPMFWLSFWFKNPQNGNWTGHNANDHVPDLNIFQQHSTPVH